MGICGCKLSDGSICNKETVWNDMCGECLDRYDNMDYCNPYKDTILEALEDKRATEQEQLDFVIKHCDGDITKIYQDSLNKTLNAIKWIEKNL